MIQNDTKEENSMNTNLFDYLKWRGDLHFNVIDFNEVDNLVLSIISYMDFGGIVPDDIRSDGIMLREAEKHLKKQHRDKQNLGLIIPKRICDFVKEASATERYGSIRLLGYVDKTDEAEGLQFSAVTFLLPDKTLFIAFRGTDDSLVGWKENFNMSFTFPVPAQEHAVEYLKNIAGTRRGKIRLGGHSKGGNLAIWAAVNAGVRIQKRILAAYNNDGPGFVERITELQEYLNIEDRLFTFVPESSVIGMLLEHSEDYVIIKSSQASLWQHDPLSWVIEGAEFTKAEKLSGFSRHIDKALTEWLSSLPHKERRHITGVLFDILGSTGAKTLSDVNAGMLKNLGTMIKSLNNVDKPTKDRLLQLFKKLFEFDKLFEWK